MNPAVEQMLGVIKKQPLSRKIIMGAVLFFVLIGFSSLFFVANRTEYQTLYSNLPPEDAADIVAKLKADKVPYRLSNGGSLISVPSDKTYDTRLTMAAEGLPKGSGVGFEIFNKTDFGTTEFVQKLNFQRALQGELARTIKEFNEVLDARVMIVMPKDSVFVEEVKPPSASILLKLRDKLDKTKVEAVVHLVASSIEDLTPDLITVVDTNGNVLSKGTPENETEVLANTQLEYKSTFERNLTGRIQTMLEKIVGLGKAIVRVTADMDFSQVDTSEEIYDPDVQVVRSRQNVEERNSKKNGPAAKVSTVNPVVPPGNRNLKESSEERARNEDTVNYEINKTIRRTIKPLGVVRRLSVAAVLDGRYEAETDEDNNTTKKFIPRSTVEIEQFTKIVKQAMGYSADREDQISVESFAFTSLHEDIIDDGTIDWISFRKTYGRSIINIVLVLLLFGMVVRPVIKTLKDIYAPVEEPDLPVAEDEEILDEPPKPKVMTLQEKAVALAKQDIDKTSNIIRGWVSEAL